MLLLIFLFGSYIINALSRFISQQIQQIKLQLLVKEYSPLPKHERSIPFCPGVVGRASDYTSQPLDKYPLP
jgi:hypothetical protein